MHGLTLTASQALSLTSPKGVTLSNLVQVVKDRLSSVHLASDFKWELRPLTNDDTPADWPPGPNGLGWRKADIDFSDIELLRRYRSPLIRVYFRNLVCNADDTKLVVTCIRHLFLDVLVKYRTLLRRRIVLLTSDPQDPNSFTHKALHVLVREGLCDFGSMFILNPENDYLGLSATTGLKKNIPKKDVFYTLDDKSWTRKCFKEQRILVEHSLDQVIVENRFGEDFKGLRPFSRIFIPLMSRTEELGPARWPVSGVFRLVRTAKQQESLSIYPRYFTWLDSYFIDFVGEVMHVVLQSYLSSWWAHSLVEKIVHGIKTGVDGSLEQIRIIRLLLFPNKESGIRSLLERNWDPSSSRWGEIEKLLQNAEFFLLDASEQVGVVTDGTLDGTNVGRNKKPKVITRLFGDVLQKAVNLSPRLAFVNNAKQQPHFNNLKEAGANTLPPVVGDEGLVLSVFRNVIENSIKYALPGESARIEFSFEITEQHVRVVIQDYGIGVPEFEEKSLFTQGFRGRKARDTTLKGRGIGLAYCKKIMEQFGGDLEFRRSERGACFVVKLTKATTSQINGGTGE